jgi:large subunit ribosomal protein L10
MSKKVKALVERDVKSRVGAVEGLAVISPRGLDGKKNNELRGRLRKAGVRVQVVKNTLARRAVGHGKLTGIERLFDGPSALVYSKDVAVPQIARLLMDEKKLNDKLELRGVFFDGDIFPGEKGVLEASKLPTREEAIALVLSSILSPGKKLAGVFKGQAGKVASLVKAVEEKAKEKEGPAPEAVPA